MTKEEIIATAIREAFKCGKEEGKSYQRMYASMQQKIDDAKAGKPDYDPHQYDGIMPLIENARLKEENLALQKQCEEKDATITDLRAQLRQYTEKATVPGCSQPGEETTADPSDCIPYSEGDQVLVSGKFFGDFASLFHATIFGLTEDYAMVIINEPDSDFDGEEHNVPYEYITKA